MWHDIFMWRARHRQHQQYHWRHQNHQSPDQDQGAYHHAQHAPQPAARFFMTPSQAVCIILVLITALTASLALLVVQSSSLRSLQQAVGFLSSSAQPASLSASSRQAPAPSSTPDQQPSASPNQQAKDAPTASPSSSPASPQSGGSPPGRSASSRDPRININTATLQDLETIKGIGPAKAQKIIDYRNQHGRFSSVDDLLHVSGIGSKTLASIRDFITVGG